MRRPSEIITSDITQRGVQNYIRSNSSSDNLSRTISQDTCANNEMVDLNHSCTNLSFDIPDTPSATDAIRNKTIFLQESASTH